MISSQESWQRRIDAMAIRAAEYAGNSEGAQAAAQYMAGELENFIKELIKQGILKGELYTS